MSDRKHFPHSAGVIAAFGFVFLMLALVLANSVTAQDGGTPEPTSAFDLNLAPTFADPTQTINPQMLPSLTGVKRAGGQRQRDHPQRAGTQYPPIGSLAQDGWIDIVGWNGWQAGRICSSVFKHDWICGCRCRLASGAAGSRGACWTFAGTSPICRL